MIEPTDRSMPPATMIIVIPSAATQTIAVCRAISSRFAGGEELRADERAEGQRDEHEADEHPAFVRASAPRAITKRCAPDASINSECSVHAVNRPRRPEPAARHHRNPIADAEQLRQVAADEEHRLRGWSRRPAHQLVDQRVDLRLAGDVDAARRLVEDEHVDVVMQQARDRHLLLVAAGELARSSGAGRAQRIASRSIQPRRRAILARRPDGERRARTASRRVSVMLSAMLNPSREPFARAILAEHAHPLLPAIVRRRQRRCRRRRVIRARSSPARGRRSRRSSRVRPAPSSPAMPRISPRCSVSGADAWRERHRARAPLRLARARPRG